MRRHVVKHVAWLGVCELSLDRVFGQSVSLHTQDVPEAHEVSFLDACQPLERRYWCGRLLLQYVPTPGQCVNLLRQRTLAPLSMTISD